MVEASLLSTHWGRVTHICISKLTIIGSDNGLSPGRRQAVIWTNAGILLIGPYGRNLSEILIEIHTFSFKKMHLKMSSGKRRPFCFGLNALSKCPQMNVTGLHWWLTHWGRDKMDAFSQTTFWNVFSWMKMFEFGLKFHWKLISKGPINNILALVQIMAWRRSGDKPLYEPMLVRLRTYICVARPQWVKSTSLQVMAWHHQEPMLTQVSVTIWRH